MTPFDGWRAMGRAMRWARRQPGITIRTLKGRHQLHYRQWTDQARDANVSIHPHPDRHTAEVRAGRADLDFFALGAYETPETRTVLRVLAALDLIPAELAEPLCDCAWLGLGTPEHIRTGFCPEIQTDSAGAGPAPAPTTQESA